MFQLSPKALPVMVPPAAIAFLKSSSGLFLKVLQSPEVCIIERQFHFHWFRFRVLFLEGVLYKYQITITEPINVILQLRGQ